MKVKLIKKNGERKANTQYGEKTVYSWKVQPQDKDAFDADIWATQTNAVWKVGDIVNVTITEKPGKNGKVYINMKEEKGEAGSSEEVLALLKVIDGKLDTLISMKASAINEDDVPEIDDESIPF